MWMRYRKLKHWATPLLLAICLWLMRGEPDESPRWTAALVLTAIIVTLYLAEEFVWMKVAQGRPCKEKGRDLSRGAVEFREGAPTICGGKPGWLRIGRRSR